jgi:positive regulator of sigma E activity
MKSRSIKTTRGVIVEQLQCQKCGEWASKCGGFFMLHGVPESTCKSCRRRASCYAKRISAHGEYTTSKMIEHDGDM